MTFCFVNYENWINFFYSIFWLECELNWFIIWRLIANSSVNIKRYECGNVNNGIFRCHSKNHNNFCVECLLCHWWWRSWNWFFFSLLTTFVRMIQNYIIIMWLKDYSIEIIISNRLFSVLQPCGKTVYQLLLTFNTCVEWMCALLLTHKTQWKTQTKRIRLA